MNKVSKGLVLVLASTLMTTAFASTKVTTGNVNAAALGAQAGQGNQAGALNQGGNSNQAGLVNNQSNNPAGPKSSSYAAFGGSTSQQGLVNTQRNQSNGDITSSQDNNTQIAIGDRIAPKNPVNNISNSNTNANVQ